MASTDFYMETPEGRIGYGLPQPYSPQETYALRDCVTWQGSTYIVLRDVKGVTPSDDHSNYALLAQRGADGAGNAKIFVGTLVTGKGSSVQTVVDGSATGDIYINDQTGDLYQATAADTWAWQMNLLASSVTVNGVREVDGNVSLTGEEIPLSGSDPRATAEAIGDTAQMLGGFTLALNATDGGLDITYKE